jgi:hypothetical protein
MSALSMGYVFDLPGAETLRRIAPRRRFWLRGERCRDFKRVALSPPGYIVLPSILSSPDIGVWLRDSKGSHQSPTTFQPIDAARPIPRRHWI